MVERTQRGVLTPGCFEPCRRKWQPTPVFLPRESCGQRSLVGCCPWGHRVGHDWSNLACMHALEKEMATHSSIQAGESQGQRSLVGHRLWGCTDWRHLVTFLQKVCQLSGGLRYKWEGSKHRPVFQEVCKRWEEKKSQEKRGTSRLSVYLAILRKGWLCVFISCFVSLVRLGRIQSSCLLAEHLLHTVKIHTQMCYYTHHSGGHFGVCLWTLVFVSEQVLVI